MIGTQSINGTSCRCRNLIREFDRGDDALGGASRQTVGASTVCAKSDASVTAVAVDTRVVGSVARKLLAFDAQADLYFVHKRYRTGN